MVSIGCAWAEEEGDINFGELAWGSTAEELNGILYEREDRYQRWTTRCIVEENSLMEPAEAFMKSDIDHIAMNALCVWKFL